MRGDCNSHAARGAALADAPALERFCLLCSFVRGDDQLPLGRDVVFVEDFGEAEHRLLRSVYRTRECSEHAWERN